MSLLERFNQRFGFTRNESLVILFLSGSLLLGGTIKIAKELTSENSHRFDYTEADQEFALRSQQSYDREGGSDSIPTPTASTERSNQKPSQVKKLKNPPEKKINVNTATKDQLMRLPGIGEAMAERILLFREDHGIFKTVEDLQNVRGIGKKKLERIIPYVTVE